MAILVVAGGILGFGYSEAIQGRSFRELDDLGVGLRVPSYLVNLIRKNLGDGLLMKGN